MRNLVPFSKKKKKVSEPVEQTRYTGAGQWIRSAVTKDEYWLTSKQNDEFDDKSIETEDDDEFNKWFEDYVVRNKCPKRPQATSSRSTYSSYSGGWGKSTWSGKGLSSWWRSDLYSGWGTWKGEHSASRTLAKAMQIVQSTIRIVDDSSPPMAVYWSQDGSSATSLQDNKIFINPAPVKKAEDNELTFEEAVDICTGLGLHEAGHANGEYGTRSVAEQLEKPEPLKPLGVVGILSNLIEDLRTEAETSRDYPGFAPYLRKTLDYTWTERSPEHNPAAWDSIESAMNALIVHLKWPEHSAEILTNQSFLDELPWWDAWNDDYQHGRTTLREAIERALERLRQNEQFSEQMQKMEEAEEKYGDNIERAVERLSTDPNTAKRIIARSCTGHTEEDDRLSAEEAAKVQQYVEERLQEIEVPHPEAGDNRPRIWQRKPVEDARSKAKYIGKPGGIVERLKAAMQFRPELARYATRLQKSGQLDEEELWRWGGGDFRVFQQQNIETYPKAHVAMLVDMSGSMEGYFGGESKVKVAQRLAQLLVLALKDMEGVTPYVYGHTGDCFDARDYGSADFMTIWEPGDPLTRLGLITSLDHGNNYDGYAIDWVVQQILEKAQPDDQKLLLVLSDGYPAGAAYGWDEAMDHVRKVVDIAEKKEVYVIQIAIDPSMRSNDQARMFKHWAHFESADKLPQQLARLVSKVLNSAASY